MTREERNQKELDTAKKLIEAGEIEGAEGELLAIIPHTEEAEKEMWRLLKIVRQAIVDKWA